MRRKLKKIFKAILILIGLGVLGLGILFWYAPEIRAKQVAAAERSHKLNPTPSSTYTFDNATTVRELNGLRHSIIQKTNPSCVGMNLAAQCARAILASYEAKNSASLLLMNTIAIGAAMDDKNSNTISPAMVLINMLDLVLLPWENANLSNFQLSQYKPSSAADIAEIKKLKDIEENLLSEGKAKILAVVQQQLVSLYKTLPIERIPANQVEATQQIQAYSQLLRRYEALKTKTYRFQ
jgi:hypothetical protein